MDLLSELNNNPYFTILKFADDGTVIISAKDSQTCVRHLNYVLHCLENWSKKWRLNINCDKNKTELICFNCAEGDRETIPNTFKLGNNIIHRVTETKVLGLVIDQDLTYKQHSEMVLRDLHARWATICKYTNKHWGFNVHVMLHPYMTRPPEDWWRTLYPNYYYLLLSLQSALIIFILATH